MPTDPLRRPRPAEGDVSDVTAYLAELERYCIQIEGIALTLQTQNRALAQALAWYADVTHYDIFGVPGYLDQSGRQSADRGARARQALKEE
jgi:hypothetical protein